MYFSSIFGHLCKYFDHCDELVNIWMCGWSLYAFLLLKWTEGFLTHCGRMTRILVISTSFISIHYTLLSHVTVYCAAVLANVYPSVGYHDLALNHISV
jgi:hypothetical protein